MADLLQFQIGPKLLQFGSVADHFFRAGKLVCVGVLGLVCHAYGGFLASLTAWCEEHSIPYEGVPVGTIKKFITGKGNAGKAAVIAAVKALGHLPEDDNEADALALLHFAREQMIGGQS